MSNYDMDALLGTYADWIAWLKEKEASLEAQLARMKGKGGEREAESVERAPVEMPEAAAPQVIPAEAEEEPPASEADDDDADDWL